MTPVSMEGRLPNESLELQEVMREYQDAVNALIVPEGTAAPTTGTWKRGTFVRNTEPAEAGSGGSKYIITGWICTASGTPGTWLQARVLTGN